MSMEYHRGRARGKYRRVIKPMSKSLPGANSYDQILLDSGFNSPNVRQLKSIWGQLLGYSTNSAAYAIGWHGFRRESSVLTADPEINNPDILSPKPFLWTAGQQSPITDLYLGGLNLAAKENLYYVIHIDYVAGSPSIFGQVKYVRSDQ